MNFTETGYFFISRASAYGVTTSYLPMFNSLNELYFGNPENVLDKKINNNETHVNRKMNVWGSGGAHSLYFKKIDEIINFVNEFDKSNNFKLEIFDKGPIKRISSKKSASPTNR